MNRKKLTTPRALIRLGLILAVAVAPPALAQAPAAPPPPTVQPLDVREPPFLGADYSWMNGNNHQPASLLAMGPLTWTAYMDAYFAWQFSQPIDHTIFPTTVAPRHDEISINLALLGFEVTGLDGPIGRLFLQYGANTETVTGQDTSKTRGFYLTNRAFDYIQQVALGWHFHVRHGLNLEVGIFSSYIAMESYLTQENWNYSHPFVSDFTPYYLSGMRLQLFPSRHTKLEVWLVNGWQTFGQWHEARAGGHLFNWRPAEWISLTHVLYLGQDAPADSSSLRVYTDNYALIRYFKGASGRAIANRGGSRFAIRSASVALVADVGYEIRGGQVSAAAAGRLTDCPGTAATMARACPSGVMTGGSLTHRLEWTDKWATTLRGDVFYDQTQAVILQFPLASPYRVPPGSFLGGGGTVTMDFLPSPWLLLRVEYTHRLANLAYFSGPGGITGPGGVLLPAGQQDLFTPDLRTSDDRIFINATLRL